MICVLKVVQGPAAGRKCWLRRDQRVTIGRLTTADFSIAADAHMSRNHLIVEGLSNSFRLRDVGSSNGTFVNDLPISVIELCTGDRIKAGTSVFEVALEVAEEDSQPAKANDNLFAAIPIRTLSSHELQDAIEEVTLRYPPGEDVGQEELPPQAETQLLSQSGRVQLLASSIAMPESANNESVSDRLPAFHVPIAFRDEFKPAADGVTWQQASTGDRSASERILEVLLKHSPKAQDKAQYKAHYSLIVNRSQVEGAESSALDFLLSTRESRLLTETLCVVESHKPENIIEIYKRCLGKDAAIFIASAEPLSNEWLRDAIDTLSYPSLLADVLHREPARAQEMAQLVYFMLYEPRGHELSLLLSQ